MSTRGTAARRTQPPPSLTSASSFDFDDDSDDDDENSLKEFLARGNGGVGSSREAGGQPSLSAHSSANFGGSDSETESGSEDLDFEVA